MSRATVRAALYAYLQAGCAGGGSVPGVTKVYRAQPWLIDGKTWNLSSDLGSGAVVFLHFMDKGETRQADPAASVSTEVVGWKQVDYQVALVVLYQYLIPSNTQSVQYTGEEWVDALDATLGGLEDLLRADPTAGTGPGGAVFEMAQSPGDLTLPQDLPRLVNGKVMSWQALHFTATEMIQA
ncbi:MAG TPA: hypothetical protein VIN75_18985 [Burkholderiaceae bacterium]